MAGDETKGRMPRLEVTVEGYDGFRFQGALDTSGNTATYNPATYTGDAPVTIGRNQHSHIILEDTKTSDRHAEIYFESGVWHLEHRSSTNPTLKNNEAVGDSTTLGNFAELSDGDVIGIGSGTLTIKLYGRE